jgi:hypothetical protein
MAPFTLGTLGLPKAEQSLVATLFRLHRVDPSFIWALSSTPPFDALLVDAGLPVQSYVHCVEPYTQVKRLSSPGNPAPGQMHRPIRSDLLVGWLSSIEVLLRQASRQTAPQTAAVVAESRVQAPAPMKASAPTERALPGDNTLFKLTRWAPPHVLAREVGRVRIATLLSRKHMSLTELAMLSRMTVTACFAFLSELEAIGILQTTERQDQRPLVPPRLVHQTSPVQPSRARPGVTSSLIHSIRRRFGIGGTP